MSYEKRQEDIVEFYKDWTNYLVNVSSNQTNQKDSIVAGARNPYYHLIDQSLRFAGVNVEEEEKWPKKVVDVGCGIGGACGYFATKFGSKCVGINISPHQIEKAKISFEANGLADKVSFVYGDAMKMPFEDGQFDLVWCMGTAEHIPDNKKFIDELARVTSPGGTIIVILTCHRDLRSGERSLGFWESTLVKWITKAIYLNTLCSSADYATLMRSASLEDVKETIINDLHKPLCYCSLKAILSWKGITSLFCSGVKAVRAVFSVPLMIVGHNTGVINTSLISCRKPIH